MADLYVMQNECGLIKIGRSRDVERRRQVLQSTDACRIVVVAIVPDAGDLEEETHIALDEHRMIGEWFAGSAAAKADIESHLRLHANVTWPFDLADDDAINCWLDELERRRFLKSRNREFSRLTNHMASIPGGNPARFFDVHICVLLSRFALVRDVRTEGGDISAYTTDMVAALSIWPDDQRPLFWAGSAWECCIAGLVARKASFVPASQVNRAFQDADS